MTKDNIIKRDFDKTNLSHKRKNLFEFKKQRSLQPR